MDQKQINSLLAPVEQWFAKLPPLPANAKEFIVVVAPWLALIFGVFVALGSLVAIGLLTFLAPFAILGGGVSATAGASFNVILALFSSIIILAAVPSLFARKILGWNLGFLSEAISLVSVILSFDFFGVIFTLIGFYILFQVKSYYK